MQCRDHRTRASLYRDGARAVRFFEAHIGRRAFAMAADDALTPDPKDFVLADHGRTYLIYTPSNAAPILSLFG